jgi:4-hydroxy-tetrahydrodipicolinate reductase
MKIALLGKGKTGSKILELTSHQVMVFDTQNPPTFEKLRGNDVIISFLPGRAFEELIPLLVESRVPVVTGSTGFTFPENFDLLLREKKIPWIHATNFSLGVVILKQLIQRLGQVDHLLRDRKVSIHEIHHMQKVDSPSGTALSIREWLGSHCSITSERSGDVVGHHSLTLETLSESITISHEAKNRSLFAEGALWAAQFLKNNSLAPGLHSFQEIVETSLSI